MGRYGGEEMPYGAVWGEEMPYGAVWGGGRTLWSGMGVRRCPMGK